MRAAMRRYRTGRHLGRTIYLIVDNPLNLTSSDLLIGIMDTPELGALVVKALNARERFLEAERRPLDETREDHQ